MRQLAIGVALLATGSPATASTLDMHWLFYQFFVTPTVLIVDDTERGGGITQHQIEDPEPYQMFEVFVQSGEARGSTMTFSVFPHSNPAARAREVEPHGLNVRHRQFDHAEGTIVFDENVDLIAASISLFHAPYDTSGNAGALLNVTLNSEAQVFEPMGLSYYTRQAFMFADDYFDAPRYEYVLSTAPGFWLRSENCYDMLRNPYDCPPGVSPMSAARFASEDISPVPLPAAGWLLLGSLAALVGLRRRKQW